MSFCNQCGSPLDGGAAQCPVCGRSTTASPATPTSPAPPRTPAKGHSGKRFVPIFLVAVVLLGVVLMGGVLLLYYHARSSIHTNKGEAEITTPFGKVASGQDSLKLARQLHVPVYPGATRADSDSATEINGMGGQVATMAFVTADPVARVMTFYRGKFPAAEVKVQSDQHGELNVVGDDRVITITAQWDGAQTKIDVSIVQHQ